VFKVSYIRTNFQSRASALPAPQLASLKTCSCTAPLCNLNWGELGTHIQ